MEHFPFFEIAGDSYEVGRRHGELLREGIQRQLAGINCSTPLPPEQSDCRQQQGAECTQHVQHAIAKLPGVQSVNVFLTSEKAVVQLDPGLVQIADIRSAVKAAGYGEAEIIDYKYRDGKGTICITNDVAGTRRSDDRHLDALGNDGLTQLSPDGLVHRGIFISKIEDLYTVRTMEPGDFPGEFPRIAMTPSSSSCSSRTRVPTGPSSAPATW